MNAPSLLILIHNPLAGVRPLDLDAGLVRLLKKTNPSETKLIMGSNI